MNHAEQCAELDGKNLYETVRKSMGIQEQGWLWDWQELSPHARLAWIAAAKEWGE